MFAYSPKKRAAAPPIESVREGLNLERSRSDRWFTVESANRLLPLVHRVASDLMLLTQSAEQQSDQARGIESLPAVSDIRSFAEELESVRAAFRTDSEQLERVQAELAALGVEVDSLADGAFDFPALRGQRPIRLCWRMGEPAISHWHEIGETCRDRQPL